MTSTSTFRRLLTGASLLTLSTIFTSMALFGCSSGPKENHAIEHMLDRETGSLDQSLAAQIMAEAPNAKGKSKSRQHVEAGIQKRVWWWMRYYSVRDRERFKRNLERGENYRPLVQQILREKQLPTELYYLAMIESGFVTHATSSTRAVGIWQFMRPTAVHYGLGVDTQFDERRHPIAATQAAAQYLYDLHREFKSWYLAISAYNAGPGRIKKAIREGGTRDFWELAEKGFLPQETMDYIPKFLAAATIGLHLNQFGFEPTHADSLSPVNLWPEIAYVEVSPKMKLSSIAHQAAISEKELLRFNPALKHALSRKDGKRVRVWIPRERADHFFERKFTEMDKSKRLRREHASL